MDVAHPDRRPDAGRGGPVARPEPAPAPDWRWGSCGHSLWTAEIAVGRHGFQALFQRASGDHWSFMWRPDAATAVRLGRAEGPTGLFAAVGGPIAEAARDFLVRARPGILRVAGTDGKRNAHYARRCGDWLVPGYRLEAVREPGNPRAAPDGTVEMVFVRTAPPS